MLERETMSAMCSPTDYSVRLDRIEKIMIKRGLLKSDDLIKKHKQSQPPNKKGKTK